MHFMGTFQNNPTVSAFLLKNYRQQSVSFCRKFILVRKIFYYLSPRDGLAIRLVSRQWKELASTNEIWETFYLQLWKKAMVYETGNQPKSDSVANQLQEYR
jgi:hypothetical protein